MNSGSLSWIQMEVHEFITDPTKDAFAVACVVLFNIMTNFVVEVDGLDWGLNYFVFVDGRLNAVMQIHKRTV